MTDTTDDYAAGVQQAYLGELAAERVYRALASRAADALQQEKYAAIADIEQLTAHTLSSVAERLGIRIADTDIETRAAERLQTLGTLSFEALIAQAAERWPPYIAAFERLTTLAPAADADALRLLVAHERALVRFIELERKTPGGRRSLQPLKALLALMPHPPGLRTPRADPRD